MPRFVIGFTGFILTMTLLVISCDRTGRISDKSNIKETGKTAELTEPILVLSILPQAYFAKRIGGSRVRLVVLTGPGQNPHSYEPSPRQTALLDEAGAWVLSGVEFEIGLVPKIRQLWPSLNIIDGTECIRFRLLDHDHDGDYEHNPRTGET